MTVEKKSLKKNVLIGLAVAFFSCIVCGVVGNLIDPPAEGESGQSTLAKQAEAEAPAVEASPIPNEPPSSAWIGKRLTSTSDLPGICASGWLEMVELSDYRSWECQDDDNIISAVSDGSTVQMVATMASDDQRAEVEVCDEVDSVEGVGAKGYQCENAYIALMPEENVMMVAASTDVLKQVIADMREDRSKFGKRIELGEFAYVIKEPKASSKIGSGYSVEEASTGTKFIVVDYTIENLANETKRALSSDFKIRDYRGRTFDPSSDVGTALAMAGKADLIISELHPGIAKEASVGFQVPQDVLNHPVTLIVPEKGLLGSETVELPFILYNYR